jgi:hypothetical protein
MRFGMKVDTLQNWERKRRKPDRRSWPIFVSSSALALQRPKLKRMRSRRSIAGRAESCRRTGLKIAYDGYARRG